MKVGKLEHFLRGLHSEDDLVFEVDGKPYKLLSLSGSKGGVVTVSMQEVSSDGMPLMPLCYCDGSTHRLGFGCY